MKKLVCFSLWGDQNIYWSGALENIKLVKKYFPDFTCRFYIDEDCDKYLIDKIKSNNNVEVILMKNEKNNFNYKNDKFNHSGLFWRFNAIKHMNENDILIFRDCDSRISRREFLAVEEWLSSDKSFHIMRDHPYHTVPILTGMWGCKNIKIDIEHLLEEWNLYKDKGKYQAEDQDFLGQFIYPMTINNSIEHSEFGLIFGSKTKPFPEKRINYEFVGDVFDENNNRHPDYWTIIKKIEG